ncbi:MAG: hypothetical protein U0175_37915 [Caldilineaceae bacterium]
MEYRHRFEVKASLADVTDFHRLSASMGAITPPPVIVRVHRAPDVLKEGDEMDFTMWLGPLPVRWVAKIEDTGPTGFADRMLQGPFTSWVHRHRFVVIDAQTTAVEDHITATLSDHLFWKLVGQLMWLNMPVLFAYRGFKTRRLLTSARSTAAVSH